MLNHYQILELPLYTTNKSAIRKAYKRLALQWHPDKQQDHSDDKFKLIGEAYTTLHDPEKKAIYDESLRRDLSEQGVEASAKLSGKAPLRVYVPSQAAATTSSSTALAAQAEGINFSALLSLAGATEEDLLQYVSANPDLGFTMLGDNLDFFNSLGKILQLQILIILFEDRGDRALQDKLIQEIQTESGKKNFCEALLALEEKKIIDLDHFYITSAELLKALAANDIYELAFENKAFLPFILRHFPEKLSIHEFLVLQKKYNIFQCVELKLSEEYQHIANRRIQTWAEALKNTFKLLLEPRELVFFSDVKPKVEHLKSIFSLKELGEIFIYWSEESFQLSHFMQLALCSYKLMEFYTDDELQIHMDKDPANYEFMVTCLSALVNSNPDLYEQNRQRATRQHPAVQSLIEQAIAFCQSIDINRLLALIFNDHLFLDFTLALNTLPELDNIPTAQLNSHSKKLLAEFFINRYSPYELIQALNQYSKQLIAHLKMHKSSLMHVIQVLTEHSDLSQDILASLAEPFSAHTFTSNEKELLPEPLQKMISAQEFFAQHMVQASSRLTFESYKQAVHDSCFYPQLFNLKIKCCITISDLLTKAQLFFARNLFLHPPEIKTALIVLVTTVIDSENEELIQEVFKNLVLVERQLLDLLWQEIVTRKKITYFFEIIPEWFNRQITGGRLDNLAAQDQAKLPALLLAKISAFQTLSFRLDKHDFSVIKMPNNTFDQKQVNALSELLHTAGIDQKTLKLLSTQLNTTETKPLLLFLLEQLSLEDRYQKNYDLCWAIEDLKTIKPAIALEMHFFTAAKKYLQVHSETISGEKLNQLLALFGSTFFEGETDCTVYLRRMQAANEIATIVAARHIASGASATAMPHNAATEIDPLTFDQLKEEILNSIASDCITEKLQNIQHTPSHYVIMNNVEELMFVTHFFQTLNATTSGDVLTHLLALTKHANKSVLTLAKKLLLQLWHERKITDKQKSNPDFIDALMLLMFESEISCKALGLLEEETSSFTENLLSKIKEKFRANYPTKAFFTDSYLGIFVRQIVFFEEEEAAINKILSSTPRLNRQEESQALYQVINIFLEKQYISKKTLFAHQQLLLNHPILWQMFLRRILGTFSFDTPPLSISIDKKEIETLLVQSEETHGVHLNEFYFLEEAQRCLNSRKNLSINHLSILHHQFGLETEISTYLERLLHIKKSLVTTAVTALKKPILKRTVLADDQAFASSCVETVLTKINDLFSQTDTVEKLTQAHSFTALKKELHCIPLTRENAVSLCILLFSFEYSDNLIQFLFFAASDCFVSFEQKLNALLRSKPEKFWTEIYIKAVKPIQAQLAIANQLLRQDRPDNPRPLDFFLKLVDSLSPPLMTRLFSSIDNDQVHRLTQFMALSPECFNIFVTVETVQLIFKKIPGAYRRPLVERFNAPLAKKILSELTHETTIEPELLWVLIKKTDFNDAKILTLNVIKLLPKHRCLQLFCKVNDFAFSENLAPPKQGKPLSDTEKSIFSAVTMFKSFSSYYCTQYRSKSELLPMAISLLTANDAKNVLFGQPSPKDVTSLKTLLAADSNDPILSVKALLEKIDLQAPDFFNPRHAYFPRLEYLAASIGLNIQEFKSSPASRAAAAPNLKQ